MILKVKFIEAHDISGLYRWWTEDMERVGQFEHAQTLEEMIDKARKSVVLLLEDHTDD